ncbi:MAG: roadblock/LC7 domain-containing protein [Actinocatenispora sp.]
MTAPTTPQGFRWLLDQFADETRGVTHVLVASGDGLQLVTGRTVPRDLGDRLAPLVASLLSTADAASSLLQLGRSDHLTVRHPLGWLLVMRVDERTGVLVVAGPDCDLRVVAGNMTRFFSGIGHTLTPELRHELHNATIRASATGHA